MKKLCPIKNCEGLMDFFKSTALSDSSTWICPKCKNFQNVDKFDELMIKLEDLKEAIRTGIIENELEFFIIVWDKNNSQYWQDGQVNGGASLAMIAKLFEKIVESNLLANPYMRMEWAEERKRHFQEKAIIAGVQDQSKMKEVPVEGPAEDNSKE